jgi:hypothetical protein
MARSIGPVGHSHRSVSVRKMTVNCFSTPEEFEADIAKQLDFIRKRSDIIEPEPKPEEGRHRRHITGWQVAPDQRCGFLIIVEWE